MKFLVLAFAALTAAPASAATYQLDVTGYYSTVTFFGDTYGNDPLVVDLNDPLLAPEFARYTDPNGFGATSGTAIFGDTYGAGQVDFSECSGLLSTLCSGFGFILSGGDFLSGGCCAFTRVSSSEIEYRDDGIYSFFGKSYLGVAALGTITSISVSEVPIPASLPLLLAGIGGLGFIGRRRKKAA